MYTRAGSTSVFLKTTQGVDSRWVQSGLLVRMKSREFSEGADGGGLLKQILFRHQSAHFDNSRPSLTSTNIQSEMEPHVNHLVLQTES